MITKYDKNPRLPGEYYEKLTLEQLLYVSNKCSFAEDDYHVVGSIFRKKFAKKLKFM